MDISIRSRSSIARIILLTVFLNFCSLVQSSSSGESSETSGNAMRPSVQSNPAWAETSAENHIKYNHHHHHHRSAVTQGTENNAIHRGNPRRPSISSSSNNVNNNNFDTDPQPCLTCASAQHNQQFESTLPEETLRAMRLEMIRQQILKKLRVTEPPRVEDMPKDHRYLPTPVVLGDTLVQKKSRDRDRDRDTEDFYGKPEQVIVFPEEAMPGCLTFTHRNDPAACFLFNIPRKIQPTEISGAELWVFKLPHPNSSRNQTFWASEILNSSPDVGVDSDASSDPLSEEYNPIPTVARSVIIARKLNFRQRQGWTSLNISAAAKHWLGSSRVHPRTLQIGCENCGMSAGESPVDTNGENRPFIVFNIAGVTPKKRVRRYVDCSPGVNECCRERFVVNFRELRMDHWIVAPPSYESFYCKGSCISVNGLSHSAQQRTTLVQKYIQRYGVNNRTAELVPCCTGTKMSSVTLFFQEPDKTLRTEILPDMVIESCGCK